MTGQRLKSLRFAGICSEARNWDLAAGIAMLTPAKPDAQVASDDVLLLILARHGSAELTFSLCRCESRFIGTKQSQRDNKIVPP
jgi:hypothetical protein